MKEIVPVVIAISMAASCSTAKDSATAESFAGGATESIGSPAAGAAPVAGKALAGSRCQAAVVAMARIYRTNGDYVGCVPVTLNRQRSGLVSFPAPSDLQGGSPVKLSGGYLLDRRGVSQATAFTRWTYAGYSGLASAPSPEEIMDSIIPGAAVTEIYEMPFPAATAEAAARCDSLIAAGLPGCRRIYP